MATFKIGKVVLGSLFKKPATKMYPVVPAEWKERTRGHIRIEGENCIACGICAKKCPTGAIEVDRTERTWAIKRMQCIQCGECVDSCPKKCLFMEPEYTEPGTEKVVDSVQLPEAKKKPKSAPAPAKDNEAGEKAEDTPAAEETSGSDGDGALKCDEENCIYCGICVKNCPVDALEVDRKEKIWKVDQDTCITCGVCVEKCPKKCLVIE